MNDKKFQIGDLVRIVSHYYPIRFRCKCGIVTNYNVSEEKETLYKEEFGYIVEIYLYNEKRYHFLYERYLELQYSS